MTNEERITVEDNIVVDVDNESIKDIKKRRKKKGSSDSVVGIHEGDAPDTAEEIEDMTGVAFTTKQMLIYASSVCPRHYSSISGTYYFWDNTVENNRIRVTDTLLGVGRPSGVLGWVDIEVK